MKNSNQHMLNIYDPDNYYNQEKSNVIMSHGFVRAGITESIRQLYKYLKEDYNLYIFDNSGHGSNTHMLFNIENQKQVLHSVLNDPILENKNNHLLLSCMPALLSSYVLISEKELLKNIKSLTIYAPVINIKNAIERNFRDKYIPKFIGYSLLYTGLLDKYLKAKNVNIDLVQTNKCKNSLTPQRNINAINEITKTTPLHLILNTGDNINDNLKEIINQKNTDISLTYKDINRHHVYFQEESDFTSVCDIQDEKHTIGEIVGKFMNKY